MTQSRSSLVLSSLVAALVMVAGCDLLQPKVDKKLAEDLVGSIFKDEGLKVDSVECPANQPMKKGHKFECVAKAHGVDVHFEVEVMDESSGTVKASARDHTLVVSDVEPLIKADLESNGHQVSKIDCHGEIWVAVKGAVGSCDITDEANAVYVWTATFTDDEGNFSHEIKPKA